MKASLIALLLLSCVAGGADGYTHEMQFGSMQLETARTGEVYKFRKFKVESLSSESEPIVEAIIFAHTKHDLPWIKLKVDHWQWKFLKSVPTIYLKKTSTGWQYLGSRFTRDPKGNLLYEY